MSTLPATLGLFGTIGWTEVIILALLGVLIFGRRLPEVGRSIGRSIVEFKKGLAGIDDDIKKEADRPVSEKGRLDKADTGESISTTTNSSTGSTKEA